MSNGGSLGGDFSLDTPEAVMQLLASVRASDISPAQKNELRDLVLTYTNGGKDPSIKIQITQQVQSLGITPVVATASKPTSTTQVVEPTHQFGSARSVPTFTPPKQSTEATPKPVDRSVAQNPTQPVKEPVAQPDPAVTPTQPEPVAPTTPTQTQTATPQSAPKPEPSVSAPAPTNDSAFDRIREIKALVNDKIGNPVNLVDINNTVGREYMSALLEAMKQVNGGGNISAAMARLETAYTAVEAVLKSHADQAGAPQSAPTPTPAPATPTPAAAIPVQPAPPTPPKPAVQPTPEAKPQPAAAPKPATAQPAPATQPHPSAAPDDRWNRASEHSPRPAMAQNSPSQPATPASTTVRSLASSKPPLKSVTDLPTAAAVNSSETGDPLYTKEVSNGLNQLLSDWMLFKKSGLFGTGPKGIEHPLFIKIKDLQVPLLLAGRFEGATQEIKQSVTDYMNGWRYEQGIVYEPGETFEHYLRRVIRHILDLQIQ